MYKYYKEVLNLYDRIAISNCLNYKFVDNKNIPNEIILKNISENKVDIEFIKKFVNTEKYLGIKKRYEEIKPRIQYYNKYSKDELIQIFIKYTKNNILSYMDIALILNELHKRNLNIDNDSFIIKYAFYYDNDLNYKIERFLNEIPVELENIDIKNIVESEFSKEILSIKNIETFSDLQDINVELVYLLLLEDIEKIACICDTYLYIIYDIDNFHNEIKETIWKYNELFVLEKRYSLNGIEQTLEEIGKQIGLTRERTRQIIKNAVDKLKKYKEKFLKIICTLFDFFQNDDNLLELEILINYLGEDNIKYYLAVILDKEIFLETSLNYNEEYKIIYFDDTLNKVINKKVSLMDNVIFLDDFNNYTIFEQQIITKEYRNKDNYYIKSNVNKSSIYCEIIDELFPNGCKIQDSANVKLINEKYYEIYGINENVDGRILSTYIERENYCMIDFGTFINRNLVPIIDEDFKSLIIDYIYTYKSVYYSQIFEKFKEKFKDYNILNWYYVKGIIDGFAENNFVTKKAYIQIANSSSTPVAEIKQFILKQESFFTLTSINDNFPGPKSYIIYNILNSMENVIFLSKEKYILLEKLPFNQHDLEVLKKNIDYLFSSLKTKVISSKKLFSRMKILCADFFERNDYIVDEYSLFSISKALLKNELNFYRPFISKEKINSYSSKGVILSYLEDFEEVKINFIMKYIKKMNIRYLSIEEILECTSDLFVQIDKETIVRKENLTINKYELESINKYLKLYSDNYGSCYTSKINSYVNFPKLRYSWNKYLLLGVIRSYLMNEYNIIQINKSKNYLNLEFEIRRK